MKIKAIVAYTKNRRIIGNNNNIPWYYPEDFKHFKETTLNCPVIMGRKTWDSLPRKPLLKRLNIVISREIHDSKNVENLVFLNSVESALELIEKLEYSVETSWVIGGQQLYKYCLDKKLIDEIVATEIKKEYDGNIFFPKLDELSWKSRIEKDNEDFQIVRYTRIE